jgi:hypothetical protein
MDVAGFASTSASASISGESTPAPSIKADSPEEIAGNALHVGSAIGPRSTDMV